MKFFRSVVERPWPERLRTPPGPPGTLRCTVLKGAKYPSGTNGPPPVLSSPNSRAAPVRASVTGCRSRAVRRSPRSRWCRSGASRTGAGETDVIVKGLGGTVVVELPGRVDADAWLPRWRAIRVPAPQRAMTRTRPITKPGRAHRRPSSAALCACLGPYRALHLGHTFDPRSILDRVLRGSVRGLHGL